MNLENLERDIKALVAKPSEKEFIYDLLAAYGLPKASITRLRNGDYNLAKEPGEILWKKTLCFKYEPAEDLHACIDELGSAAAVRKQRPRFLIVTDLRTLLAIDTKTGDTLDAPVKDLAQHYDFFLPWAGLEKSEVQGENPADVKAAVRMGRLYELIVQDNNPRTDKQRHALNVFLARLLFCFFAEDTEIFGPNQFTNAIASHTSEDGKDLQQYLSKLFGVLSTTKRSGYPKYLTDFPYVNGGLFDEDYPVPVFSRKSRQIILECGALDWRAINPDIFGSMIQAVMHDDRGSLGMHYTSVANILKAIEPLFLADLRAELDRAGESKAKLTKFLERLYKLRIFDPACGSGNFLIIAFKELCKLEIDALKRIHGQQTSFRFDSKIRLSQFYGIEIEDFAHQTAKLSLWLAEHQMNLHFKEVFGTTRPTLPLQDGGNILCGNATWMDWLTVCPPTADAEIYLIGNPPYAGARNQGQQQKADLAHVFNDHPDYKDSDYVCAWYLKAIDYIARRNARFAFVSTNSICQGEQVAYLWPRVLVSGEISFAHQAFKWTNNAKGNAGVTCVIVGVRNPEDTPKLLISDARIRKVKNISPYLHEGTNTIIRSAKAPLSPVPRMVMGSMPRDGGHLILSKDEALKLTDEFPDAAVLLRDFMGTDEFLHSSPRACLWISDEQLELANSIPPVRTRIQAVRKFRLASKAKTTNGYASIPHKMAQRSHQAGHSIVVPSVSSERREYVPNGFLDEATVISNLAFAIYEPNPVVFAIISSRMHNIWVRTVGGGLETRIRYSSSVCYNTFPFPKTNAKQAAALEEHAFRILDERERNPEKTIAELYDPDSMPSGLLAAHRELDTLVEGCYQSRPFRSDEERQKLLFELYEALVESAKEEA